ncbi:hypothetical protein [Streptomyces sp. NPDC059909]|uniref:hypothetical protein n=1 Tax=Streptomyces sp. NPDC059909 TaxID=3346998 RepID=UPI00364B93B1
MSFPWIWVTACTAVALPLAVLLLLGRAPAWLHRRVGPRGIRARGALLLAACAGALVQGVLDLAGAGRTDWYALRMLPGPVLMFAAIGWVAWVDRVERRSVRPGPTSQ